MIMVSAYKYFTTSEINQASTALSRCNLVLYSQAFAEAVLSHTYLGRPGFASCAHEPSKVLESLRILDIKIVLSIQSPPWYKRFTSEIAREVDGEVIFNRRKFGWLGVEGTCGTLMHESCHAAGFTHDYGRTAARPYSVPYALGEIAQSLAKKMVAL